MKVSHTDYNLPVHSQNHPNESQSFHEFDDSALQNEGSMSKVEEDKRRNPFLLFFW